MLRSIIVGSGFGVIFAGATMYAGHKSGLIDGGNIPAAILAFGALSVILGRRPVADDGNLAQTVSSSAAMMSITGGLIGPVAALVIANDAPSMPLVVLWGIAVGVAGCLLAVPLRASFITRGTLPFPSGAATAEVLGGIYGGARSAARHVRLLLAGGVTTFGFAFARSFMHLVPEEKILPVTIGSIPAAAIGLGVQWSPLLASVGYLAGTRAALSMAAGSMIAWLVIAPQLVAAGIAAPDYISLVNWLLWGGTGLMLGGTVAGIVATVRDIRASFAATDGFALTRAHAIQLAITSVIVIVLGTVTFGVNPLIPTAGLVLSVVLSAAAARAMGETDNTPAGPLGGFGQVVIGAAAPGGIHAPLAAGGIVNGTLMHAAMMLQNWKTGALVKTSPRDQLIAQLVGVVVGAIACAGAFELIRGAYGLGTEAMPAPAAMSWKATAEAVQHGISAMPAYAPLAALIGFAVGIVLVIPRIAKFAPSPVAMGMAFILPPYLSFTIAIGGFTYWIIAKRSKTAAEDGIAIASGAIGGEAIAGLVIAALILAGLSP